MRNADIASGAVLLLLGLVTLIWVIPAEVSGRSDYGLPPDFFPRVLAWLFIALTALLVAHRLLARRRGRPEAETDRPPMRGADWAFITGAAAVFAGLYLVMAHIGFVAAGVIAVAVVGTLMAGWRPHPLRLAALALIAPPVVYWVFKHLFMVYLPA
ncbi:tripartite tricarboxylate transporter TctB family protein [Azospirillum halopraeferens]|uniref:tripartite tricarboxylate transporter TctB family protein n=1 Tax=Azospirillum halopraeferens TaxID=34010 RepID=UPI0003FFA77C|nr:tripartite tricarboxylate transporter TctB family protein [Azospirillum halopraeferens]